MAANTSGRSRKGIGGGKTRPCIRCGSLERTASRSCKPCSKDYARGWRERNRSRLNDKANVRRRRIRETTGRTLSDPVAAMYYGAKNRSAASGIPFDLTLDFVRNLVATATCEYCGRHVVSQSWKMNMASPSLDRLVPLDGYTQKNIVLACMDCNSRKQNHTVESLRVLADRIERAIARKHTSLVD